MDNELKSFLFERGADIVRFVDISELPTKHTQGFTKAIIFCMGLSKRFVLDTYNNMAVEHDDYLEKDQRVNDLAEFLAEYIQKKVIVPMLNLNIIILKIEILILKQRQVHCHIRR